MRKNYQMWLLGALFGGLVLPFAGCSNEDDPTPNGPGNGETVKTEFTVKFTHGNQTKAGEAEVGSSTSFAGMEKINLLGYGTTADDNYVTGTDQLVDLITLSNMEAGLSNDFVKKYNISLQPEKQSFMFYGESSVNSANSGVGKLTATYPSASAAANTTTFALEGLAEPTTTEMQSYLQNVIQAAVGAVKSENQVQLQGFLTNCKSPALYQVASMLDQLYFRDAGFWQDGQQVSVQSAIKASNPVFKDLSSFGGSVEGDLLKEINTDNVDYLGDLYPRGGKTLKITCDFGSSTNSTVEFEDNANTFYRPTSLYYMANSYLVEYTNEPSWIEGVATGDFVDLFSKRPSKVALRDQIQYAVGQLLVNFKVTAGSLSGNEDVPVNINASDINLKGIIIGNQKQVGWDFMPKGTSGSDAAYDNTGVEDKDGSSENIYGTMRMLALPTAAQQPITIALELENASTSSFEGANGGTIPAGATFYVTAKLDPKGQTVPNMADEKVAVFMSDYVTTANLTLASLKYAENTVPDLDDANLEFALSVNLQWNPGITFDVEIP